MGQVSENAFLELRYEAEDDIIVADWKTATSNMQPQGFRASIRMLWAALAEYKPQGMIGETRRFYFTIDPEDQRWYADNIGDQVGRHTPKVAMIVSSEMIAQMSIEQTIEEDTTSGFTTRYFDNFDEARVWIVAEAG